MIMTSNTTIEFKNEIQIPSQAIQSHVSGDMIAPGGSSCTLGCSCSCSCGAVSQA